MNNLNTQSAPIRGTQSFVGVMTAVWKRPALTGIEILWRAIAFAPAWFVSAVMLGSLGMDVHFFGAGSAAPASTPPPSPEQALHALQSFFTALQSLNTPITRLHLLEFAIYWIAIATYGRAIILRRLNPELRTPWVQLFFLNFVRFALTSACIVAWIATTAFAFHHFVWMRLVNGEDANVILAFTLIVVSALALFIVYCATAWILQLGPIAVMNPVVHVGTPELRSKLIEINLVMGIVKVCLLVLAMVFSACPLPFSNVETQQFLNYWWLGVAIFWIVASDFFHVVRAAAYLRLYDMYKIPPVETA